MSKRYSLLFGWFACTLLGTWLLWFDYNFSVFGQKTLGDTFIGQTPIRVVHLAVLSFAVGVVFLRRWMRRP